MSIRLNLTSPTEEARAELARLQRAQRATYLGVSVWSWLALAVGSVAVGLALAVAGLLPSPDSDSVLLAECARTNGAALTVEDCSEYLEWLDATADCRELESQSDWADCVETVEAVLTAEMEERLEQIRASRSGLRDWEDGL